MTNFLQVTTTTASREEAERIAVALVELRLAGCVQVVGPVWSVYRWREAVEQADEWLCLIKTTREQYASVEAAVRERHSYECPELIAVPIEAASEDYMRWLAAETQ